MGRAWMVRAGEGADTLAQMVAAGVIAVRYPQVQADARTLSADHIEKLIRDSGRLQPGVRRVRLGWFASDMSVGDLIVTPDARHREVWLAEVTGDYRFDPEPPVQGYFHWRPVTWLGVISRDHLDASHRQEISVRPTINQNLDYEFWSSSSSTQAGVRPPGSPKAVGRKKSPGTSTPSAKVGISGSSMVTCANPACGLQYASSIMVNGLCPDCRG